MKGLQEFTLGHPDIRRDIFTNWSICLSDVGTERFSSSFVSRTSQAWNSLLASILPNLYNTNILKMRLNLPGEPVPL